MSKLRVFESFSGYGSQSIALQNIGVPHEVVAISEIDADVIISYGAIRGDITQPVNLSDDEIKEWLMSRNIGWDFQKGKSSIPRMKKDKLYKLYNACIQHNCLGDISIVDTNNIPDHDLFTYSFPCTDISVAGKQAGLTKGEGTRSGLLWECEKIIAAKKPKYLLMENVKNLVGKKFKADFDEWCDWLSAQGYKNFYQVLNAKDYGVPQNRERVFMVSILDENATYEFPPKIPLELRLKDVLEGAVEDKYYLEQKHVDKIMTSNFMQERLRIQTGDACGTLLARDYKDPKCVEVSSDCHNSEKIISKRIGGIFDDEKGTHQAGSVWDKGGLSPTVDTCQGGYRQPCVIDDTYANREPREYTEACPTLRSERSGLKVGENYRIRKLTPTECWKLMGMSKEDIQKCIDVGISNSQLYKQAGNSIVVDVLEYIFKELFKDYIVKENFTKPLEG